MPLSVLSVLNTRKGIREVEEGRSQESNSGQTVLNVMHSPRTGSDRSPHPTVPVPQGRGEQAISTELHAAATTHHSLSGPLRNPGSVSSMISSQSKRQEKQPAQVKHLPCVLQAHC